MSDSEDDFEYDEEAEQEEEVELGFVSKVQKHDGELMMHRNPDWSEWDGGKVGGKPVWLNPQTIPTTDQLACPECTLPMAFILQIYCPLDDEPDAFHRSLYVFCCRNSDCSHQGRACKVFRAQLPKLNAFYAEESGVKEPRRSDDSVVPSLCSLCGQRAVFTCSACNVARYCCKAHQKDHWSHGHKQDCSKCLETHQLIESEDSVTKLRNKGSKWVFPEYEMEIDHEPDSREAANEYEAKLLADFEKNHKVGGTKAAEGEESDPFTDDSAIDVTQKELSEAIGASTDQDKQYIRFLTRVALAKDQVLRYARWQENSVLWVHSKMILENAKAEIPPCSHCGSERQFEFQILPQLLFYLHVDQKSSLSAIGDKSCDWGTLVVYTCVNSCVLDGQYAEEFLHYQSPYAGA